jgi:hypothetical protein
MLLCQRVASQREITAFHTVFLNRKFYCSTVNWVYNSDQTQHIILEEADHSGLAVYFFFISGVRLFWYCGHYWPIIDDR